MSSHSYIHLLSSLPTTPQSSVIPPFHHHQPPLLFPGFWCQIEKDKQVKLGNRCRCINAISKPRIQESVDVLHQQNGLPVINWPYEIVGDETQEEALKGNVAESNDVIEHVKGIKAMLRSMEDGEITISAYDTAWVALVEDLNETGTPQFPSSLEWIAENQLPDGSWGDGDIFEAHDRLINTLACVIALTSWNLHPDKCEKGLSFFKDNLCKLEDENAEHMPIGFEVAFPSLLEIARKLKIDVPDNSRALQEIYARRNLKLTKIPKEIMHNVPTTLLHSLEGMPGLDWEKLLQLQSQDGSFLFSPSSTAFALMQTKDENCLKYLNKMVQRFKGGVPNVYPVDLFEHIWIVDRLQRLGISRYFQPEIRECVSYVHRYWTKYGICWARNSVLQDIDDTAMGFRILRLHGYDVSPDAFKHFQKDGKFFCFVGQSTQAVTGMFNLYRAAQLLFPGEKVLEDGREFSSKFLREKQAANELVDKWIIMKDLPGEVEFALDVPWYATLPRVETRFYIEQYGGHDDVWIGKTLYRMPYVNNNDYLQLAKLDYNNCQALHHIEWDSFQKWWYQEYNLRGFGVRRRALLLAYFISAASIFEPDRSNQRLAWAKTTVLLETIESFLGRDSSTSTAERKAFLHEFKNGVGASLSVNGRRWDPKRRKMVELVRMLHGTINHISVDELVAHGRDISSSLRLAWEKWLLLFVGEGERHKGEAELLVQTVHLSGGPWESGEHLIHHPRYEQLAKLANKICHQLGHFQKLKVQDNGSHSSSNDRRITSPQIETDMQELVQLVLENSSDDIDSNIKQTFLTVAKSFYYCAFCDADTINDHISKVLFERVQ